MGSLVNFLPLLFFVFFLDPWFYGVPFFNSFYSKDLILEFAYSCYVLDGDFIFFFFLCILFLFLFYISFFWIMIFFHFFLKVFLFFAFFLVFSFDFLFIYFFLSLILF